MKRNRKIIRYSARYSKKARTKRLLLNILLTLLIIAVVGSLGLIAVGYIVGGEDASSSETFDNSSAIVSSDTSSDTSDESSSGEISSAPSSSQEASSEQQPPAAVLSGAVTMPYETVLSAAARDAFLEQAVQNGYRTVIFEVKSTEGKVLYDTEVALAIKSGAKAENAYSLTELVDAIHESGLKAVALMNALKDPIAAHTDYGTSYRYGDTEITWLDNSVSRGGKSWMNPYEANAQQYLTDLTKELSGAGCEMVLVDKLVFPTAYTSKLNQGPSTVSRQDMLSDLCMMIDDAAGSCQTAFCFDAQSYFGKHTAQYNGTPSGISSPETIAPRINLAAFEDVQAVKEAGISSFTAQNVKVILDEIKTQSPNARIMPIFMGDALSEEVLSLLTEYGITDYILA